MVTFDLQQIGAVNAGSGNLDQNLTRPGMRHQNLF